MRASLSWLLSMDGLNLLQYLLDKEKIKTTQLDPYILAQISLRVSKNSPEIINIENGVPTEIRFFGRTYKLKELS